MKGKPFTGIILLLCILPITLAGQDSPRTLGDIRSSLDRYRGREVTLTLRLQHRDPWFQKVIFYDEKNHPVEFDVHKPTKTLRQDMINFHEGMLYRVTFEVGPVGEMGILTGELIRCVPVALEKIP
jgi:hypothetical protein